MILEVDGFKIGKFDWNFPKRLFKFCVDITLQLKSKTNKKMSRESFGYFTVSTITASQDCCMGGNSIEEG